MATGTHTLLGSSLSFPLQDGAPVEGLEQLTLDH